MKALAICENSKLIVTERARPDMRPDEILIRVHSSGMNRADLLQCEGRYPAPQGVVADIPGLEVAGEVVEVGGNVTRFKTGDRVCALLAGGGYASEVSVSELCAFPMPSDLTYAQGASLPEALYTVWLNVFELGQLRPQQKILIHGGSSGIGSFAIMLAKAFDCEITVTVGSELKAAYCRELGAHQCVLYRAVDFEEQLQGSQFDVILDMVGGDYFSKNINLLGFEGRLVYINAMGGRTGELDIVKLMQKRLTVTGSTLRNRSSEFKFQIGMSLEAKILPLIKSKVILPRVYREFSYEQANEALELMKSSNHMGKLVLNWS